MLGQGSDNNELFISLYNILSHKDSVQVIKYLKAFNYMERNASFVSVATSDSVIFFVLSYDGIVK